MAVDDEDSDVPEYGAVFTFGKSKFNDNEPGKFWLRDDRVLHIACGDEHTAIVSESGKLFTFGDNSWGQLGLGHTKPVNKPSRVKKLFDEKVTLVACGKSHTLVLTESSKLYAFGANGDGQLGVEGVEDDRISTPTCVAAANKSKIKVLSAGTYHSAFLTESGELFIWGSGSEGQLGLGEDVEKATTPTQLFFFENVVNISCGYYHTAVVTESGKLFTFGETEGGKLGHGSEDESDHTIPGLVRSIKEKVVSVSCGHCHTAAVTDTGKVYTFGDGSNGQLGHGNLVLSSDDPIAISWPYKTTRIVTVCCGEGHTAFISDRGVLYTCGDGRHGKLALGEENFSNQFLPTVVSRFSKFFVQEVSCGGCHMLVNAKPRQENGDAAYSDESFAESNEVENTDVLSSVDAIKQSELTNSFDLSGSISARNRRREKLPDPMQTLNRTLPPLNSISSKPLSPLIQKKMNDNNPLNKGQIPHITRQQAVSTFSAAPPNGDIDNLSSDESSSVKQKEAKPNGLLPQPKPRSQQSLENARPTPIARLKANTSALESHKISKDLDDEGNESGIDEEDDIEEDSDSDKETKINSKDTAISLLRVEEDLHKNGIVEEKKNEKKKQKDEEPNKKGFSLFSRKKPKIDPEEVDKLDKDKKDKKKEKKKKKDIEEEISDIDENEDKDKDKKDKEKDKKDKEKDKKNKEKDKEKDKSKSNKKDEEDPEDEEDEKKKTDQDKKDKKDKDGKQKKSKDEKNKKKNKEDEDEDDEEDEMKNDKKKKEKKDKKKKDEKKKKKDEDDEDDIENEEDEDEEDDKKNKKSKKDKKDKDGKKKKDEKKKKDVDEEEEDVDEEDDEKEQKSKNKKDKEKDKDKGKDKEKGKDKDKSKDKEKKDNDKNSEKKNDEDDEDDKDDEDNDAEEKGSKSIKADSTKATAATDAEKKSGKKDDESKKETKVEETKTEVPPKEVKEEKKSSFCAIL